MTVDHMNCCGVQEICDIESHRSPQKALDTLFDEWYVPESSAKPTRYNLRTYRYEEYGEPITYPAQISVPAFAIFTDIADRKYGVRLMTLIENLGLGTVTKSEPALNYNSMNNVIVFTWQINREKFVELAKKSLAKRKAA
jgi:hypothetical protein